MREGFLPFSRPRISEEEIAAVSEVLRSGWITTGPRVAEFESRFAEAVQAPSAVPLAAATADLLPATEWNSDRICSLPLFPDMSDADVRSVVDAIKEVLAP